MSSAHVLPLRIYFGVFCALLVLTGTTVAVAFVDLGPLNNVVALGIAVLSAAISDARRNRPGVRLWFEQVNHSLLDFWCEVLRIDPKVVRRRVRVMPEAPLDRQRAR